MAETMKERQIDTPERDRQQPSHPELRAAPGAAPVLEYVFTWGLPAQSAHDASQYLDALPSGGANAVPNSITPLRLQIVDTTAFAGLEAGTTYLIQIVPAEDEA